MTDHHEHPLRQSLAILLSGGRFDAGTLTTWAAQVFRQSGNQLLLQPPEQNDWLRGLPQAAHQSALTLHQSLRDFLGALRAHGGSVEGVTDPVLQARLREECEQIVFLRNSLATIVSAGPTLLSGLFEADALEPTRRVLQEVDDAAASMLSAWVHLRNDLELPLLAASRWLPLIQQAAFQFASRVQEPSPQQWSQAATVHPSSQDLTGYIFNELPKHTHALVHAHVHLCLECEELVKQLSPMGELRGEVIERILQESLADSVPVWQRIAGWFLVPELSDHRSAALPELAWAAAADDAPAPPPRFFASCDALGRVCVAGLVFGMAVDQNRTYLLVESQTDQTDLLDVKCCLADTRSPAGAPQILRPIREEEPQWQFSLPAAELARVRDGEAELVVVGTYRNAKGQTASVAVVYTNIFQQG